MRRMLVLALVMSLAFGSLATAEAAKKKKKKKKPVKVERVVEFDYTCPCGVSGVVGFQLGGLTGENIGGGPVTFDPTTENFLVATTENAGGQKIAVRIAMDTDPDNTSPNDNVADFCSETEEPIEMPDVEAEFRVFIYNGQCTDGSPSLPTQGTITFTLSNIP